MWARYEVCFKRSFRARVDGSGGVGCGSGTPSQSGGPVEMYKGHQQPSNGPDISQALTLHASYTEKLIQTTMHI
jgi:hypothetical protein